MKRNNVPITAKRLIVSLLLLLAISFAYIGAAMCGAFDGVSDASELRAVYADRGDN